MVKIVNRHERVLNATREQVGALMATLSSKEDQLWPNKQWPAMRFDRPLEVGATGGHGPIRYFVASYTPNDSIVFQFTGPRGFHGTHGFYIHEADASHTRLEHVIDMNITGTALITWPLLYRPLHNALAEDSVHQAVLHFNHNLEPTPTWSGYVRFLRRLLSR